MFRQLQEKAAILGTLSESNDTVRMEVNDLKKSFEATNASNIIQYKHKFDLDRADTAAMAVLYASFGPMFDETDTFITKEFLDELKSKYLKCPEPVTEECLVAFMKAISTPLKTNLYAFSHAGRNAVRSFKIVNDPGFPNKYIYFDFEDSVAGNIPPADLQKMNTDFLILVPEWPRRKSDRRSKTVKARRMSDVTERSSETRKKSDAKKEAEREAKKILDREADLKREAERESKRAEEEKRAEREAKRAEREGAEREAKRAEREDAEREAKRADAEREQEAESAESDSEGDSEGDSESDAESQEPEDLSARSSSGRSVRSSSGRSGRSKTQKAVKASVYNEIIEGMTPDDKLADYMTERFTDRVMLTPQQDALSSYPTKTAKQLYGEAKAANLFNKIVPAYLAKCTLAMKRSGLQVIHVNPHMCQLISKLGFGTVDDKKLRLLRTYSTSVQLRTALQLRNLIAQIILKHKNPADMEADSICAIDSEFIYDVLKEEQQTVLLGVHRDRRDMITSFLTFHPSSLKEGERLKDEKLEALWRKRQLAFIDFGCAPSAQNKNQLLLNRPGHYELLLYFAILNIVAASHKRARKYAGICTTLQGTTPLEPLLQGLGFQEVGDQTYALYGSDDVFVELLDVLDKKLDGFSSPYMTELCKGKVCK